MKDGGSLNLTHCLVVESINIIMFLVFGIAWRNRRYRCSFNANIRSTLILVENYGFGIFDTASDSARFGLLKIVFRN